VSDYYVRLTEKQKLRGIYGVDEKQFRRYLELAAGKPGVTGVELLRLLETRLDAVVLRLGFARTIRQARQLVSQGHVLVNGKRVKARSNRVRPGQVVEMARRAKEFPSVREATDESESVPPYLQRDDEQLRGTMLRLPERDEIPLPVAIDERLVVEHYAA
jgi:small subunit ribosomal protein S4